MDEAHARSGPGSTPGRVVSAWSRRSFLRRGALGGAALWAAGAGASARALAQGLPTNANHPIVLSFLADTSLPNTKVGISILTEATAPFVAANRGIRLNPGFMVGNTIIPQMLSGTGPDVISDWNASPYWAGNLLLPLDSYIQRDNLNTSVYSAGQWSVMQQPFGTFMLPAYFSPMVYIVRLSDFDELGLAYPNPDWSYTEYTDIARKLTIHTSKRTRYGTDVQFHHTRIGGESWLFKAFGGDLMNADGTAQTLSAPGSIQGAQWVFEELFWPGIGSYRDQFWGSTGIDGLLQDQQAMRVVWGNGMLMAAASNIRDQFKWDFYPAPVFPQGRMTQGTEDFYGINAETRYPEQAWALLKYLAYDPTFTRFLMRVDAQTPALIHLWPEWQSVVQQMAPPLRGKSLQWYADAALKGYALPGQYFRYGDTQVRAIDDPWISKLWSRQTDVPSAFRSADKQANAFLQTAAQTSRQQAAVSGLLQGALGKSQVTQFPAPPKTGGGEAATLAPHLATFSKGVYTLHGAGQGFNKTMGANGTFFCAPATASKETFTCRVTSIQLGTAPSFTNGAKVGLMVRGDLSNTAATAAVVLAGQRGIHFSAQSLPAGGYEDQRAGSGPGLLSASAVFSSATKPPAGNFLLHPIWLRLERDDGTWSAFTSTDGTHWQAGGVPVGVSAAAVWVGLFVTAKDANFGKSGLTIVATFDHVTGFTPKTVYQLGNP